MEICYEVLKVDYVNDELILTQVKVFISEESANKWLMDNSSKGITYTVLKTFIKH